MNTPDTEPSVCAIIVTFNRVKLLERCVNALLTQTRRPDKILVVDNGSTDGTREWLQSRPEVEFITQSNEGSAGGFATGIRRALGMGVYHLWVMDDDGWAEGDCLEVMLKESASTQCAYLAPNVIDA